MSRRTVWDAIVVGSGAAGGWAAKELTELGLSTLLLEAGRSLDLGKDFTVAAAKSDSKMQLMSRSAAILRGQQVQARCMSFGPLTRHLFVNDRENPYVTPAGKPFNWYRGRQVGGRLHLWGRNAIRLSDTELKPTPIDGFGNDWPISYRDLEPWYDRVEKFLGVHGSSAGLPNIPDGKYESSHPLTRAEQRLLRTLGAKWPDRPATTARIIRHNPLRVPLPILAAQRTGRLELRSNAVVSHITIDANSNKAKGVVYIDRDTKQAREVLGKVVVLCASTIESLRILLNSTSPHHPCGIGNSSGNLGRYLTDHVMVFEAGPHDLEPGITGSDPYDFGQQTGVYLPSFRNRPGSKARDFIRGYSLLGGVGRIAPGWFFMAVGEMLPRYENFVALNHDKRDAYGIPVARITCAHSDNEKAMVRDMHQSIQQLAQTCGLEVNRLEKEHLVTRMVYRIASPLVYTDEEALLPGSAVHEAGGARMGDDPQRFVLNRFNQCWDAKNVLVTDSAAFTTSPFQNPGLTIMAMTARACHHIANELRLGEV